jgi:hypothetical protein
LRTGKQPFILLHMAYHREIKKFCCICKFFHYFDAYNLTPIMDPLF